MAGFLEFTWGSCWDADFRFTSEDGSPENVADETFSVVDAKPDVIANAVFTKTNAAGGLVHMHLAAEHAGELRVGGNYSFRVSRQRSGGHVRNTEIIGVRIK